MTEPSFTKLTEIWPLCGEASQAIYHGDPAVRYPVHR